LETNLSFTQPVTLGKNVIMSDDLYFEPPTRMQLVDKLAHLLRFSHAFAMLSGPRGSGLTTVVDQVAAQLAEGDTLVLTPQLQDNTSLTSLLRVLNNTIDNIDNNDATDPLAEFHWKVEYLIHSGKKIFLCIDNADYLHEEALQCLVNLHIANNDNVGIMLAGSPNCSAKLESVVASVGAIKNLQIQKLLPFNQLETQEFIHQYFVRGSDFSKKQLAEIYHKSQGYPGRIVAMTTEMIKVGKIGLNAKNGLLPLPHKVGIGVLLVAIVGALSWQIVNEGDTDQLVADNQGYTNSINIPLDVSDDAVNHSPDLSLQEQIAALTQQIDGHKKDIQGLAVAEAQLLVEQTIIIDDGSVEQEQASVDSSDGDVLDLQATTDDATDTVLADDISNEPLNDVIDERAADNTVVQQLNDLSASIKGDVELALSQPEAPSNVAANTDNTKSALIANSNTSAQVKVATEKSNVKQVEQPAIVANNNWSGVNAIKQWPDKGFTLQLLAAANKNSAIKFLNGTVQAQRMYLYQTQLKGKPWSVVVYGQYSTRANANAAIAKLPSELKQLKTWVKSINSVKNAIK
jgi:DamX protein